ncbi:MAG TPA: hypothetical protein VNR70_15115 [Steroidobacteraceae bacterium]|nr:hypothetical protein [Steroidobacteraceae bacterium]
MKFRRARLLIATPILAWIAVLSPASAGAPAAVPSNGHAGCPSNFDYLVLASLADSSSLLAMSAFREPPRAGW